jgi:hypothetical protein
MKKQIQIIRGAMQVVSCTVLLACAATVFGEKPTVKITSPKPAANSTIASVTQHFTAGQMDAFQGILFTATATNEVGSLTWTYSTAKNGPKTPMTSELDSNGGKSMLFSFGPAAKAGTRWITVTATNKEGSDSATLEVNYQPTYSMPLLEILYPTANSEISSGIVLMLGRALSAQGGYVPCTGITWETATGSILTSLAVNGAAEGECKAQTVIGPSSSPQKLTMLVTDTTGQKTDAAVSVIISASALKYNIAIDSPTPGQEFLIVNGAAKAINLHAFATNGPSTGLFTYTWSWYQTGSSLSTAKVIGTGESMTWNDSAACGAVTIHVVGTSPSVPDAQSPWAEQKINVSCQILQ